MTTGFRLLCLATLASIAGCTSVYQVRGVEPALDGDVVIRQIENEELDNRELIRALEARSVEPHPAIEAVKFREFEADLREVIGSDRRRYSKRQTPVLLVLTSTADTPDRVAFPLSRWLLPRHWFKGAAVRQALGHYRPSRTHELSSTRKVDHDYDDFEPSSCQCPQYVVRQALSEEQRAQQELNAAALDFGDLVSYRAEINNLFLEPVFEADRPWDANAPFWVVRSDESVIASHNDIYNENVVRFLVAFLDGFFRAKELEAMQGESR